MTTSTEIKIVKLVNGDDIVCHIPSKGQLPEANALIRLIKPLQVKYVPQVTPTGIRDYIALIRWTNYTEDYVVTIPKDKIMTITNASVPMAESWSHISKEYDKSPLAPNTGGLQDTKQMSNKQNDELNEIFDEFMDRDGEETIH